MLAMQGAIASKRALAPEERPKRLREGWASRSDVRMARGACDAQGCANGAGRMDAPERRCAGGLSPIPYPLSAIPFFLACGVLSRGSRALPSISARIEQIFAVSSTPESRTLGLGTASASHARC
jgi:hypothetical protein